MPSSSNTSGFELMWGLLSGFIWMDRCLQENLASRGWPPVSRTESQILVLIGEGIVRPTEIARALGLSRQAINQAAKPLIERGLVSLDTDPDDGRCKILRVSDEGQPLFANATGIMKGMERELQDRLGKRRVESLRDALMRDWGELPVIEDDG